MDWITPLKYIGMFIVGLFALYCVIRITTYAGFVSYFQAKYFYYKLNHSKTNTKGE